MVTGGRSRRRRGKGAKDPMDMVFRSIRRNEEARGKGKANPSAKLKISGRNEKQEARSKKKDATKKAAPKGERMKVVAPPKEPPKKAGPKKVYRDVKDPRITYSSPRPGKTRRPKKRGK